MTDSITEAPAVGTLHNLDDHRPPAGGPTVRLVKDAPPEQAAGQQERQPIEGTVISSRPSGKQARSRVRAALTHRRTRGAGRMVARHGSYVVGGAVVVTRRAWDGRTTAVHQRMIKQAEATGQHEVASEWQDKADRFRQARHTRRMALITGIPGMARATAIGAGLVEGGLLTIGTCMAIHDHQIHDVIAPTMGVIDFVHTVCMIVGVLWGPTTVLAPWLALLALWAVGKARGVAPAWTMPIEQGENRQVVPDEGAILDALRHLGIAPLNKAVKEGWQPRWIGPTTRLGNGWHSQLQLPMGVTVEMVNAKKTILAHNLMRKPVEVWPIEPADKPAVLDLWVADQGSLSGKVPDWPLLHDGDADYFKGVPVGVSQRGDQVIGKLMASNYMVGGIMGSGKSSLVISLLLGASLDPLVEIEAYVMAYNVDYDPMRERLRVLVKGDEDEQIEAAVKALRGLREEVTERGKLLEQLGGDEVRLTRELAAKDARMRPKVVVFDECHELFMHKKYGPEAAELAVKVMKKARKVGITLIFVTVSPTADSIPKDVTRNTSHRVAFAVGDHVANDGLLGTGKHKAGITATTLNPAENVGTALTVGFTKNAFELVRSYYVKKDSSTDQVSPVVARALALRDGITPAAAPAEQTGPVDHPANIVTVLGERPTLRSTEVLARLMSTWPETYSKWSLANLTEALTEIGAQPRKLGGIMTVRRSTVLDGIEERDENTPESDSA